MSARGVAVGGWIVIAAALVFRRRPEPRRELQRDPSWKAGLLLQTAGITLLFALRGRSASPPLAAASMALTAGSVAFMASAQRALGENFAYQARITEGHRLVGEGPYAIVRHPIYTGLTGLALATGFAFSTWQAWLLFTPLYVAGTRIRIRAEEALLRDRFGEEFDDYARRVPAFLPGLR